MAPCNKKTPCCKPKKPAKRVKKKNVPCKGGKRHANRCYACGRIAARKRKNGVSPVFAKFFSHVCWNLRQQKIVQSGCISMIQAKRCWRLLTDEQKEDFKKKVGGGGGCNGRGTSGPSSSPPGDGGCSNHVDPFSWSSFTVPSSRHATRDTEAPVQRGGGNRPTYGWIWMDPDTISGQSHPQPDGLNEQTGDSGGLYEPYFTLSDDPFP